MKITLNIILTMIIITMFGQDDVISHTCEREQTGVRCLSKWWTMSTGHCIRVLGDDKTYNDAVMRCKVFYCGSDLPDINVAANITKCFRGIEQDYFWNNFPDTFWLKSDSTQTRVWSTVDGRARTVNSREEHRRVCVLQHGQINMSLTVKDSHDVIMSTISAGPGMLITRPSQTVTLICEVHGASPKYMEVWSNRQGRISYTFFSSKITVNVTSPDQCGEEKHSIYCDARVCSSSYDMRRNITLITPCKPDCPTDFRVTHQGLDYITLTWQPGWNGGLEQWFNVSYRKRNETWKNIIGDIHTTSVNISDVTANSTYTFKIQSYNNISSDSCGNNTLQIRPECPIDLQATRIGADHVKLVWQPLLLAGDNQAFLIFHSTGIKDDEWRKLDTGINQSSVEVNNLIEDTVYYFRVVSLNKYNNIKNINKDTCTKTTQIKTALAIPAMTCPVVVEGRESPDITCEMKTANLPPFTSVTFSKSGSTTKVATCKSTYTCDSSKGYRTTVEAGTGKIVSTLKIQQVTREDGNTWTCSFVFGDRVTRTNDCEIKVHESDDALGIPVIIGIVATGFVILIVIVIIAVTRLVQWNIKRKRPRGIRTYAIPGEVDINEHPYASVNVDEEIYDVIPDDLPNADAPLLCTREPETEDGYHRVIDNVNQTEDVNSDSTPMVNLGKDEYITPIDYPYAGQSADQHSQARGTRKLTKDGNSDGKRVINLAKDDYITPIDYPYADQSAIQHSQANGARWLLSKYGNSHDKRVVRLAKDEYITPTDDPDTDQPPGQHSPEDRTRSLAEDEDGKHVMNLEKDEYITPIDDPYADKPENNHGRAEGIRTLAEDGPKQQHDDYTYNHQAAACGGHSQVKEETGKSMYEGIHQKRVADLGVEDNLQHSDITKPEEPVKTGDDKQTLPREVFHSAENNQTEHEKVQSADDEHSNKRNNIVFHRIGSEPESIDHNQLRHFLNSIGGRSRLRRSNNSTVQTRRSRVGEVVKNAEEQEVCNQTFELETRNPRKYANRKLPDPGQFN